MRLIKLFTVDHGYYFDADKWEKHQGTERLLVAYTKTGERVHDLDTPYYRRKKEENCFYGFVHPANLATSKKQAIANREEIYKELFPSLYEVQNVA